MKNENINKASEMLKQFNESNKTEKKAFRRCDSSNKRVRSFFIRSYIPFDKLCAFLRSAHWVQHYAIICHDKDKWSAEDEKVNPDHKNGSAKQSHCHIILYTFDAKSSSSVLKLFDRFAVSLNSEKPEGTHVEIPSSVTSAYRYLRHLDDPDKYQYPIEELVSDDPLYWSKHDETDGLNGDNKGLSMVEDILDGVSERDMCLRYGKEYIYHSKYLRESADRIRYEENHFDVTPALVDAILDASPYYEIDKLKFKEIFAYIQNAFSKQMDGKQAFQIYLEKELFSNGNC